MWTEVVNKYFGKERRGGGGFRYKGISAVITGRERHVGVVAFNRGGYFPGKRSLPERRLFRPQHSMIISSFANRLCIRISTEGQSEYERIFSRRNKSEISNCAPNVAFLYKTVRTRAGPKNSSSAISSHAYVRKGDVKSRLRGVAFHNYGTLSRVYIVYASRPAVTVETKVKVVGFRLRGKEVNEFTCPNSRDSAERGETERERERAGNGKRTETMGRMSVVRERKEDARRRKGEGRGKRKRTRQGDASLSAAEEGGNRRCGYVSRVRSPDATRGSVCRARRCWPRA